ncbi:hypothetical protein EDD96_5263 [Streptomyces sp. Ag109_G2-6]|nr:hypothetical protein [Streptomyces katrae]RPF41461.1 hypothetical protein EDD96_5263 [Streptomyces sp. Ag109_G2-6]
MVPVHLTLTQTGGGTPDESQAHALVDILWAHATPECGMEHIRARTTPAGIGIILFIRAASTDIAHAKAGRLMTGALASGATCARGYSVTLHH